MTLRPTESCEGVEIFSDVSLGLALSEHGPGLIGGAGTLDDVSLTTKIAVDSGEETTFNCSRPFQMCRNPKIDGFTTSIEQE